MLHTRQTWIPVATVDSSVAIRRRLDPRREPAPARYLLQYVQGWAEADTAKIVDAVSADYSFIDPLVGSFDRASLEHYFAILRQRVGFDSSSIPQRKVCLDLFPTPRWPARQLRFWRSIPECGLSGPSDIEMNGAHVRREVVSYDLNIATEWLSGRAPR